MVKVLIIIFCGILLILVVLVMLRWMCLIFFVNLVKNIVVEYELVFFEKFVFFKLVIFDDLIFLVNVLLSGIF